jgi:hypothetical protein
LFHDPNPSLIFFPLHCASLSLSSMTADNDSFDYDDPTLISLLASLDLADNETSPPPPPRTPSPCPASHPTVQRHTFPAMNGRSHAATRLAIYQYESPTRRGHTTEWFADSDPYSLCPNLFHQVRHWHCHSRCPQRLRSCCWGSTPHPKQAQVRGLRCILWPPCRCIFYMVFHSSFLVLLN